MLINSQLVKDHFGQYYKIQTSKDKPAPLSLEAEIFRSNAQAAQFINNLVAPVSFWSKIVNSESLIFKSISNEKQLKEAVAELFSRGKIKAFRVDIPSLSQHAPEKRTVKDSNKNTHTFVPASSLLITNPSEVKKFTDTTEATKYLKELSPNRVELQNLTKELDLPVTSADDEFAELLDLVAKGLAGGSIVVVVDRFSAPPSSGADAGGAVHGDKDASKGPEKPACTFDQMLIQCSHYPKDRSYKLDVVKDKPNLNDYDKALQVIAKPGDPDEVTVTYAGSCANNSKECPSIKISSDTLNETSVENPYKFKALPQDNQRKPGDFMDFLKYYLVPDLSSLKYQVYTVEKSGCNGNEGQIAKVHAFPVFKWEGSVSFGYEQKDGSNIKQNSNAHEKGEWKLESKLAGNVGSREYDFSTTDKNETDKYFPGFKGLIGELIDDIDSMGTKSENLGQSVAGMAGISSDVGDDALLKFNVTWPKVSLAGNVELKESPDNFDIDIGGEISLSLSPLIQASVRTDILDWIILASGPQGKFLLKVKNKIKNHADIAVDIILDGKIESALKWTKNANEKWLSTEGTKEGEATLGVFIGLEARAKATVEIFYIKVTLGVEFHAKGNTAKGAKEGIGIIFGLHSTTNKDLPAIGGRITFTGVAIYFSYYAEVSKAEMSSEDADDEDVSRGGNDDNDAGNDNVGKEREMRKIEGLLESRQFPEKPDLGSGNKIDEIGI